MAPEAIIALISALVPLVNNLVDIIDKIQADLRQSDELTKETEAALDQAIADLKVKPEEWQKPQPE